MDQNLISLKLGDISNQLQNVTISEINLTNTSILTGQPVLAINVKNNNLHLSNITLTNVTADNIVRVD
jgi:hypothetical protein